MLDLSCIVGIFCCILVIIIFSPGVTYQLNNVLRKHFGETNVSCVFFKTKTKHSIGWKFPLPYNVRKFPLPYNVREFPFFLKCLIQCRNKNTVFWAPWQVIWRRLQNSPQQGETRPSWINNSSVLNHTEWFEILVFPTPVTGRQHLFTVPALGHPTLFQSLAILCKEISLAI